jgi:DNA-directed RNA polymerase specialized sigma24 family protein
MAATEEPVALTEALRAGAPDAFGALYDEHAGQLYAYCHIMVGDEAADAVCDAFVAVARHPDSVPADEDTLPVWLHALARAECVRRGAPVRTPATTASSNPMWRALAGLSPEDREVLALATALVPEEIAVVLGVTWDTAESRLRVSQRRLEHALSLAEGQGTHQPVMLTSLNEVTLRRMVMRMYEPPERERERTLSSCAAAEHEAGGTLVFDADGMPVVPDTPSENADEPTPAFAEDSREEPATAPSSSAGTATAPEPETEDGGTTPAVRGGRAERRREAFRTRRIEGLLQVAGLGILVLVAAGIMAMRADRSGGSSGEGGAGLPLHRKGTTSPSVQPAPPALPSQAAPAVPPSPLPALSPNPPPSTAPADADTPLPPDGSNPAHPVPPPSYPRPPVDRPTSPVDPPPTPTPAPSDSPTGKGSRSPTPLPSGS